MESVAVGLPIPSEKNPGPKGLLTVAPMKLSSGSLAVHEYWGFVLLESYPVPMVLA